MNIDTLREHVLIRPEGVECYWERIKIIKYWECPIFDRVMV